MIYYQNKTKTPSDWKNYRISDIGTVVGGGTPSTKIEKYYGGNIPWITPRDLSNHNEVYIEKGERNITGEGLSNSSATLMPKGTVLFTSRAPIGYVAIAKNEVSTNQGFKSIICNQNAHNRFIYYWLKHNKVNIERFASGSTFKEISGTILKNIEIILPTYIEQQEIASILFSLDSKIELSQKMNKVLEAMGRAIFKHWFIDFEFPNEKNKSYKSMGGDMVYHKDLGKDLPKNWKIVPLKQIVEFMRGFSYKGSEKSKTDGEYMFVTLNSVKEFGGFKREFSYITSDRIKAKHFVRYGDIIIANTEQTKTGTLLGYPALVEFPFQYEKNEGVFSHHITKVIPKLENLKHYVYHYLFTYQQNAVKYHTGSVIWALDVNSWSKNETIILPPTEILQKFELLMKNMFLKISENNLQIETLSRIRDSLLPKLMSGKIRITMGEAK